MSRGGLTFVTVVHAGELPLLGLQARSLARHLTDAGIAAVHIYVNDLDEASVCARVARIVSEYGELADRVRVFGGTEAFLHKRTTRPRMAARAALYHLAARYPWLQMIRRRGWNGNDGWRVQQAFKLASARHVETPHTVFLDTKNIFLRPMVHADFVAPDGRARSWFSPHVGKSAWWLGRSQIAMGQPKDPVPSEITTFVTPFVAETALLRDLLEALEARNGPVENFFAFRLNNATEFMLINAYCNAFRGGVRAVFADGLVRSHTVWGDPVLLDSVLAEAVAEDAQCIGLHRQALPRLGPAHRMLVADLLKSGGLIDGPTDLEQLIDAIRPVGHRHVA